MLWKGLCASRTVATNHELQKWTLRYFRIHCGLDKKKTLVLVLCCDEIGRR